MNVYILHDIQPNDIEQSRKSLHFDAGPQSRVDSINSDETSYYIHQSAATLTRRVGARCNRT